jgi:hypothetical protein
VKRVKKVSTLSVGLGLTAAGIRMLEDVVSNEQRIARPSKEIKGLLLIKKRILKKKKMSFPHHSSVLNFFKSPSKIRV